ncbi:MAG: hypothetical protein ACK5MV_02590 [Aminipila sp.]
MKLTDEKLKTMLAFVFKNKDQILSLADYFDPSDIENGKLNIPDYMVNVGLKDKILNIEQAKAYLKDYTVLFQNDCIMLDLRINIKQLGPIAAKYLISIKDFKFGDGNSKLYATFKEDVTSLGNVMQSMALKALMGNGTCLQKVIQLVNCEFIYVDGHNLMIDLGKIDIINKVSDIFELNYIGSNDGQIKFSFYYCG